MKKVVTIIFADDNLRNEQSQIVVNFSNVYFNAGDVTIERPGYDKAFLDFVVYCNDILGGFNNGRTFISIPASKIVSISIIEK